MAASPSSFSDHTTCTAIQHWMGYTAANPQMAGGNVEGMEYAELETATLAHVE
jgi:hypothetical protein